MQTRLNTGTAPIGIIRKAAPKLIFELVPLGAVPFGVMSFEANATLPIRQLCGSHVTLKILLSRYTFL